MTSIIITTSLVLVGFVGLVGSWYIDKVGLNDITRQLSANVLCMAGLFGLALRLMGWF